MGQNLLRCTVHSIRSLIVNSTDNKIKSRISTKAPEELPLFFPRLVPVDNKCTGRLYHRNDRCAINHCVLLNRSVRVSHGFCLRKVCGVVDGIVGAVKGQVPFLAVQSVVSDAWIHFNQPVHLLRRRLLIAP